ncbi:MAG: hypothetical protein ACOCQG_02980 [Candidatus Nanoarchaeia archaeon]
MIFLVIMLCVKIVILLHKYHEPIWDEAVFMGMGKYIYSGGESGLWELIRPLGLPIILGLFWLTGIDYITASGFVIFAFAAGSFILTYFLARDLFNQRIAIIAVIITYITPFFFYFSNRILTGIPALFFCLAAVYSFTKKRYALSAMLCFLAFFFRYPAGIILVALGILIFLTYYYENSIKNIIKNLKENPKPALEFSVTFVLLFLLFLIMNKFVHNSFLHPLLEASAHQSTLAGNVEGIGYFIFYPVSLITANALFLFAFYIPRRSKKILVVLVPFLLFFLYFQLIPHKEERFLILLLPFLSILAAVGIFRAFERLKKSRLKIFMFVVIILFVSFSIFQCFVTLERFPCEEPDYVDSYYNFFKNIEFVGTIFTSDPVPAAYTDHKYIHFYSEGDGGLKRLKTFEADAFIYYSGAFPWNDTKSLKNLEIMKGFIREKSYLALNETVRDESREVYIKKRG